MPNGNERMSGNKGEWSELYVFFRLLAEGRIYAANEKVMKIADVCYPIRNISREEFPGRKIRYVISREDDSVTVARADGAENFSVPRSELGAQADKLLAEIKEHSGSFELEEVARFANGICVTKIKAPSSDTTDIAMEIEDIYTNRTQQVGFSVKSELGNAPTLLNAGETTNFVYRIEGIDRAAAAEINAVNSRRKITERIEAVFKKGGSLEYCGMHSPAFRRNLVMVDSLMPEILGNLLLYSYCSGRTDMTELCDMLGGHDPFGYGDPGIYRYKVKKFLCACALGMKPGTHWDGLDEANGGYIIVKEDGEILAYHIYNRNLFEQYLLDNTRLDRASTSRHRYMSIYEENGGMFIKFNLQVRFKR